MDDRLRTAVQSAACPQRIRQGEALNEFRRQQSATPCGGDDNLRRVLFERGKSQSVGNDTKGVRLKIGRSGDRRQVQPQRGDQEPGETFGGLGGTEKQAVEVFVGAGDLGDIRDPLPDEGDAAIRASLREGKRHRFPA